MSLLDPEYLDAIKGFEGYAATPSWDYKQSSSGYGTKAQAGDENIPPDQLKAIHEQRFQKETDNAAASVDSFNPNLPPGVRAALTSLTYNSGPHWQQSGLGAAIQAGDMDKAKELFLQYNKAGGEVNPGLVSRRQQEVAWFGGGLPTAQRVASAAAGSPSSAIPQQQQPIFPQAQAAPQAAPSAFAQMPAPEMAQAPPIFFAPRKQIDLSQLRAALASRAPIFPQG
jgi:lysozyme